MRSPALLLSLLVLALTAGPAAAAPRGDAVEADYTVGGSRVVIDATSGPDGEDPGGTVQIGDAAQRVTGLEVDGTSARVSYRLGDAPEWFVVVSEEHGLSSSPLYPWPFGVQDIGPVEGGTIEVRDNPRTRRPRRATEDAVRGEGSTSTQTTSFSRHLIDVRSGPSGQDPEGRVVVDEERPRATAQQLYREGSPTCLRVRGGKAVIGFALDPALSFLRLPDDTRRPLDEAYGRLTVVGNPGVVTYEFSSEPLDCAVEVTGAGKLTEKLLVQDGFPSPRRLRDCWNGGWKRFGFRSHWRCLRHVIRP